MADLARLYRHRPVEEVSMLLTRALMLAKDNPKLDWGDIQNTLKIGAEEASIILDWLADKNEAEPHISTHWIRCGRAYVLNNPFPNLVDMAKALEIGERRAFLIMLALEKKKLLRITQDFSFERLRPMSTFMDLVRQMKPIAKKYRGRCEPTLLMRTLYIDPMTAMRLAQYGEETLGYRWKKRPQQLH